MEEVDNIILLTLRQIGTEIEDNVVTLKELTTEAFVEGCARCINAINNNEEIPTKLPPGMSARFRMGTTLATACKNLGYNVEIGYNTFLYSNESDSRPLLMWLVERLPKESSDAAAEAMGPSALLLKTAGNEIAKRLNQPWLPPSFKKNGVGWAVDKASWFMESMRGTHWFEAERVLVVDTTNAALSKEEKHYCGEVLPALTAQPFHSRNVAASLTAYNSSEFVSSSEWEAEWNTKGLMSGLSKEEYLKKKRNNIRSKMNDRLRTAVVKGESEDKKDVDMMKYLSSFGENSETSNTNFANKQELQFTKEDNETSLPREATEEELQARRDEELKALEAELAALVDKLDSMESDIKGFLSNTEKLKEQTDSILKSNAEANETNAVRGKVLDLLPNADENIAKLQEMADSSAKKLIALAEKWEEHRKALLSEYRSLKNASVSAKSESQNQLEEIQQLKEETKQVLESTKAKDLLVTQLQSEVDNMKKDSNRSSYTQRILEIVSSIARQKEDIAKVLVDTRVLQRDINQLTEKLNRTYTITDEVIFKDAKKDEACRKAYKQLAALHSTCTTLVQTVETTGSIMRDIRDLEDQIDTEQRKNMTENFNRIYSDYKTVKNENASLVSEIKSVRE